MCVHGPVTRMLSCLAYTRTPIASPRQVVYNFGPNGSLQMSPQAVLEFSTRSHDYVDAYINLAFTDLLLKKYNPLKFVQYFYILKK
jgi:hypothetical protein